MKRKTTILLILVLAAATTGTAVAGDKLGQPQGAKLDHEPVLHKSPTDDFQVMFPSGCGQLRVRNNEPTGYDAESLANFIEVQHVFCDRYQETGEGCSLVAVFDWRDEEGNEAGPEAVAGYIASTLEGFAAIADSQKPIKRKYTDEIELQGLSVLARDPQGSGIVRVLGLLSGRDIFILTAWNENGDPLNDPDMNEFFNSFQPFVD